MNQISPFKSSAVRITLVYVLLFGLSVSVVLGVVYWSTIAYKTNQTDDDINAEIKALSTTYARGGYPRLLRVLSERVQQQRPGDSTLYLLTDDKFQPLVGNISSWPRQAWNKEGWLDFKLETLDDDPQGFNARARTFVVEGRFNLLVGQGMRDLATLKSLVGRGLIWGLVLTVVLGIVGGLMMRQMLRRRLGSINQIARKIMQGDLRKRIAASETGDEFDQLAINLNLMLDQIERGMEGVRRVSDNIAHDLKTPLARMKNRVEELRFQVAGRPEEEVMVDQVIQEADGLLATFNALLRIARIEYSEQREDFKAVDVNSILYDLKELYEPLAEDKGQNLNVAISLPMVIQADRDMLFQAFANLLDNAIKYTPEKGMIGIRAHQSDIGWQIEIADNGPGIPEAEFDKITQRFYRIDPSRSTPGSGLGLALVLAVLKLHDMQLSFANNNPGLKVLVTIPQRGLERKRRGSRSTPLGGGKTEGGKKRLADQAAVATS